MKLNVWICIVIGVIFACSISAQEQNAPPPVPAPPPATTLPPITEPPPADKPAAPAAKATNTVRRAQAKRAVETEPFSPPVTVGPAIVKQNNINVRNKSAMKSEVLARLKKGDRVDVLEIISQPQKADEPDKWARIPLPTNAAAWIFIDLIDATNHTVKVARANIRSGPSEDHSVIGRLEKGVVVKDLEHKGDWIRIEPPQSIYGFVAAHLLAPAVAPVEIAKTDTTTPAKPEADAAALPKPVETKVESSVAPAKPGDLAAATPANPTPQLDTKALETRIDTEEIKRVVAREGIVKRSVSIQAPTWFVLESPQTGRTINYLHTPITNIVVRDFFGQRVIVTGEEGLDERWPNTPVINVESIEVVP